MSTRSAPDLVRVASLVEYIKETEDYYDRNKDKLKEFDARGRQTVSLKSSALQPRKPKLEQCNLLIKQERSALKVLIRKHDYFKPKPESSYREKQLPLIRAKIIKHRENLRRLKAWRRSYLRSLKPVTELHAHFETEVFRKEYERRQREGFKG